MWIYYDAMVDYLMYQTNLDFFRFNISNHFAVIVVHDNNTLHFLHQQRKLVNLYMIECFSNTSTKTVTLKTWTKCNDSKKLMVNFTNTLHEDFDCIYKHLKALKDWAKAWGKCAKQQT